jgi:hypothetical protein
MSSTRPFFRFSLRSLLLVVAVAAVASWWYRSHLAFRRSPSKAEQWGGYRATGDPEHLRTRIYRDHDDRLVAILLLAFDGLDVNGPRMSLTHGYNSQDGGSLAIDGSLIEPQARPRFFANDPFGRVVELDLTPREAEVLARCRLETEIEAFYRHIVEPKFFRPEGRTDEKGRQGLWTYRLLSGELYKEVAYADGLRHGEIKTYYRTGALKSAQSFNRGRPMGECTLYKPDGDVLAIIDSAAPIGRRSPAKSNRHVRRWQAQVDDKNGYRLFIDGAELQMPQ